MFIHISLCAHYRTALPHLHLVIAKGDLLEILGGVDGRLPVGGLLGNLVRLQAGAVFAKGIEVVEVEGFDHALQLRPATITLLLLQPLLYPLKLIINFLN